MSTCKGQPHKLEVLAENVRGWDVVRCTKCLKVMCHKATAKGKL